MLAVLIQANSAIVAYGSLKLLTETELEYAVDGCQHLNAVVANRLLDQESPSTNIP